MTTWQFGSAPADYEITNVRAVTPDAVVDGARIVVREGLIAEVAQGDATGVTAVDGRGLLVIPGLIDMHSDALEKERTPRPNGEVPWEFALSSLEARLVGAGVTTIFHGAAFQHQTFRGGKRSVEVAHQICQTIDEHVSHRVDHRILHRLDMLSQEGAEALRERLATGSYDRAPLISHEDHTPGQGQYADPSYMVNYLVHADGKTEAEAWAEIERLQAEGQSHAGIRAANLAWLGELATAGRIVLAGHDPDTPEVIDDLSSRGGHVAEFPTTLDAARRAKEKGLAIVAGSPNLLRGRSHSGNISAEELLRASTLDALASDYAPTTLLGSVWRVVAQGICPLPQAIALITSGPAAAAGLGDRGALVPGLRADLAIVDDHVGPWPAVVTTMAAGR